MKFLTQPICNTMALENISYVDIILAIPLCWGVIQGVRHGLVKEIASLIAIIIGIYVARYWSVGVADFLTDITRWTPDICQIIAYILVFIMVALIIHLLAYMISKILSAIMLGWVNRLLGALFGVVKMLLILSLVLNIIALLDDYMPIKDNKAVKSSLLYKPIEQTIPNILPFLNWDKLGDMNFDDYKINI